MDCLNFLSVNLSPLLLYHISNLTSTPLELFFSFNFWLLLVEKLRTVSVFLNSLNLMYLLYSFFSFLSTTIMPRSAYLRRLRGIKIVALCCKFSTILKFFYAICYLYPIKPIGILGDTRPAAQRMFHVEQLRCKNFRQYFNTLAL